MAKKGTTKAMTGRDFDALPAVEKERIFRELDDLTPADARRKFRPMTTTEKRNYVRCTSVPAKNSGGRAKTGDAGR